MLDPEFKKQWVEALRSGEFPQGKKALKTTEGYCCLGVACVLKGLEFEEEARFNLIPDHPEIICYKLTTGDFALPDPYKAKEWGLKSNLGPIPLEHQSRARKIANSKGYHIEDSFSLAHLNDDDSLAHLNDDGVPFSVIADIIEECF